MAASGDARSVARARNPRTEDTLKECKLDTDLCLRNHSNPFWNSASSRKIVTMLSRGRPTTNWSREAS